MSKFEQTVSPDGQTAPMNEKGKMTRSFSLLAATWFAFCVVLRCKVLFNLKCNHKIK